MFLPSFSLNCCTRLNLPAHIPPLIPTTKCFLALLELETRSQKLTDCLREDLFLPREKLSLLSCNPISSLLSYPSIMGVVN
jgi:hypothetical protein